jgi:hypothetical protein
MTFTPADFCIGESGIWFFSLMWEHGNTAAPVEFLDDRNILGTYRSRGARMRTEEDELREHQEAVRRVDPSRRRHPATKVKIGKWEIEEDELERQHQEAEERGKARAQRTAGQGG